jgi:hypothetical protein
MKTETSELGQIESLCDWLSQGPMPAKNLASRLGQVESEGRSALYVIPSSSLWQKIIISHPRDAEEVSYVEMSLKRPGALDVSALKARFGTATEQVKVHWDSPTRLYFEVDRSPERPLRCRVVAEVSEARAENAENEGTAKVVSLAVQPEPR